MEVVLPQSQMTSMDKGGSVVLDIENLTQATDKCSGSPKMTKALSRKGSCRMERRSVEEQETEDPSKKFVVKVMCSQLDQLKLPMATNKSFTAATATTTSPSHTDSVDGRSKRSTHPTSIHPRKILLLFATMSSVGTMILIFFTLAINRRGGDA